MNKVTEFDRHDTDMPVCPHCGEINDDSNDRLECGRTAGNEKCWNCDKEYHWTAEYDVTYRTEKECPWD